jgi:hypothetical protein
MKNSDDSPHDMSGEICCHARLVWHALSSLTSIIEKYSRVKGRPDFIRKWRAIRVYRNKVLANK